MEWKELKTYVPNWTSSKQWIQNQNPESGKIPESLVRESQHWRTQNSVPPQCFLHGTRNVRTVVRTFFTANFENLLLNRMMDFVSSSMLRSSMTSTNSMQTALECECYLEETAQHSIQPSAHNSKIQQCPRKFSLCSPQRRLLHGGRIPVTGSKRSPVHIIS